MSREVEVAASHGGAIEPYLAGALTSGDSRMAGSIWRAMQLKRRFVSKNKGAMHCALSEDLDKFLRQYGVLQILFRS
jgi:hypothetical protein